ncbi:MAG: hypothetical protein FJW31_19270 [Acidobacteria bacterium]|nr:hypothetical protein [Acidobacteriota bacterium]
MMKNLNLALILAALPLAAEWGKPTVVTHEEEPVVTYRAQMSGGILLVEVKLVPGWHTFTMDTDKRAAAKLAGKKATAQDRPTSIEAVSGVEITGKWKQSAPKDFSHPELRLYSWGFEKDALFAAPVRSSGAGVVKLKAQACTEKVCKNISVEIEVPKGSGASSPPNLAGLIEVE